jgi:hypothetical protein
MQQFQPVTIQLTFENQQELDAFGTVFNFSPVGEAYSELSGDRKVDAHFQIYEEVIKLGGDVSVKIDEFQNKIKSSVIFR